MKIIVRLGSRIRKFGWHNSSPTVTRRADWPSSSRALFLALSCLPLAGNGFFLLQTLSAWLVKLFVVHYLLPQQLQRQLSFLVNSLVPRFLRWRNVNGASRYAEMYELAVTARITKALLSNFLGSLLWKANQAWLLCQAFNLVRFSYCRVPADFIFSVSFFLLHAQKFESPKPELILQSEISHSPINDAVLVSMVVRLCNAIVESLPFHPTQPAIKSRRKLSQDLSHSRSFHQGNRSSIVMGSYEDLLLDTNTVFISKNITSQFSSVGAGPISLQGFA